MNNRHTNSKDTKKDADVIKKLGDDFSDKENMRMPLNIICMQSISSQILKQLGIIWVMRIFD